jgi:trans-aconitate 2-methyltransferase
VGNDGSYTFGDSARAATRLALLAEVFEEATTGFLLRLRGERQRLAVDLGCGPGFTTVLLDDLIAPEHVIGVDASAAFASQAARRLGSRGEVVCADVRDLPTEVQDADLIFARFLLTHLTEPAAAIEHWVSRISPTGVVAVQEVESITTGESTFMRYLELQRLMLEAHGSSLDVGPMIADARRAPGAVLHNDVVHLTPSASTAARMFAMNFAEWRTRPTVAALASSVELDEIELGLRTLSADEGSDASITWELRELVVGGGGSTAAA